jgi:hypothetical protein
MSHVTSLEVLASLAIKSFLSYFIFFSTTPTFIDLTTGFILQSYKVVGTSQVFQRSTSPYSFILQRCKAADNSQTIQTPTFLTYNPSTGLTLQGYRTAVTSQRPQASNLLDKYTAGVCRAATLRVPLQGLSHRSPHAYPLLRLSTTRCLSIPNP